MCVCLNRRYLRKNFVTNRRVFSNQGGEGPSVVCLSKQTPSLYVRTDVHGMSVNEVTRRAVVCPSKQTPKNGIFGAFPCGHGQTGAFPCNATLDVQTLIKNLDIHGFSILFFF